MTAFTRTWNAAYEAQPADTENISLGASRIRNLKEDTQERGEVDHSWAGDVDDGEHKKITFAAPIATPANVANKSFLYEKDVSAKVELHYLDEDGNEVQLTSAGATGTITGEIRLWSTGTPPAGWVFCNGSAYDSVADTTFAALFALIANLYGGSDGTDFKVPDLRGRVPIGSGTGDASDATAHVVGDKEGTETHTLTIAQMPLHTHNITANNTSFLGGPEGHTGPGTGGPASGTTGGDGAHNNLQPSLTLNYIIKK